MIVFHIKSKWFCKQKCSFNKIEQFIGALHKTNLTILTFLRFYPVILCHNLWHLVSLRLHKIMPPVSLNPLCTSCAIWNNDHGSNTLLLTEYVKIVNVFTREKVTLSFTFFIILQQVNTFSNLHNDQFTNDHKYCG